MVLALFASVRQRVGTPGTVPNTADTYLNALQILAEGIIAVLVWLLSTGPALLLWIAILFFPAQMAWRKLKPRLAKA